MKITVIGSGYVGLVLATYLANLGNDVIGLDIDKKKIELLNKGKLPIYEPGLAEMFKFNLEEKRLSFTSNAKHAIQSSTVIFIAVGTPQGEDNNADLSAVKAVASDIGKHMNEYKVIVNKSTVPVGTADMVKKIIAQNQKEKIGFDVVSNPEFLREGAAIKDFENPDRIIIGTDSEKAKKIMASLYSSIARTGKPIVFTDIRSAELIKYASNAMLAARISFMNQLSQLCEKVGADIKEVAKGIGLDSRIGPRFLQAGIGYGGSCFPKDVRALIHTFKQHNSDASMFEEIDRINENQRKLFLEKIIKNIDPKGKKIAVWGLAFKPKTDDMREAPSVDIIKGLQNLGAKITAFDPVAMHNAKKILTDISYADNPYAAVEDSDALLIMTEWDLFRNIDKQKIKQLMKSPVVFDGRNIYNPKEMKSLGFNYFGVGRQ